MTDYSPNIPLVSVIIPTFNEEKYLPKLLECLVRQTYPKLEIIVADADSQDKTRAIVSQYGFKLVKGGNVAEGRNAGASSAKGKIYCFLDSDVLVEKNFINKSIREIIDRKLTIATCTFHPITHSKLIKYSYKAYNSWVKLGAVIGIPRATGTCIFVRDWLFNKVKGFDASIKLAEDHSFAITCNKYGKFGHLESSAHYVSVRRIYKEGYIRLLIKSVLCELHLLILGPIKHNFFNYQMDGHSLNNPSDLFLCDYSYFEEKIFRNT